MLDYSAVQLILDSLGDIFGIVVALGALLIFSKAEEYLTSHTSRTQQKLIAHFVETFVQSADQIYHDNDETGNIRKQYVRDHMEAVGVKINAEVESMIEAAVWNVNQSSQSKGDGASAKRK